MRFCVICGNSIGQGTHCEKCGLKCLYCGTINSKVFKDCLLCHRPLFKVTEASNPGVLRMAYANLTAPSQNALDTQGLCASKTRILFSGPEVLLMVNGEVWDKMLIEEWQA